MVIGHEKCGAVEATLESIQQHQPANGDIAVLVDATTPAVAAAEQRPGDLLDNTVRANAQQSLDTINKSSELTGPLSSGQFKAVAAYFSIDDGRVSLIWWCVSELADFFERDAAACDLGQDRLGFRSPDVGAGVLIVGVEVFLD